MYTCMHADVLIKFPHAHALRWRHKINEFMYGNNIVGVRVCVRTSACLVMYDIVHGPTYTRHSEKAPWFGMW